MSSGLPRQFPILVLQVDDDLASRQVAGIIPAKNQYLVAVDLWWHYIDIVERRPRKLLRGELGQKDQLLPYAMNVKLQRFQLDVSTCTFHSNPDWNKKFSITLIGWKSLPAKCCS